MTRWYQRSGNDVLLTAHVQPRASKDSIDGLHGGRLKIRITAPPIDNKANAHLLRYLAQLFGVPCYKAILLSGELPAALSGLID